MVRLRTALLVRPTVSSAREASSAVTRFDSYRAHQQRTTCTTQRVQVRLQFPIRCRYCWLLLRMHSIHDAWTILQFVTRLHAGLMSTDGTFLRKRAKYAVRCIGILMSPGKNFLTRKRECRRGSSVSRIIESICDRPTH